MPLFATLPDVFTLISLSPMGESVDTAKDCGTA
ncbi:hypothetical protein AWB81_02940 [Caballeronia arationis]|jgi:hypothetical protein|nr:hypothetical protein AWB81_02940 [Caballeronia arationis]